MIEHSKPPRDLADTQWLGMSQELHRSNRTGATSAMATLTRTGSRTMSHVGPDRSFLTADDLNMVTVDMVVIDPNPLSN